MLVVSTCRRVRLKLGNSALIGKFEVGKHRHQHRHSPQTTHQSKRATGTEIDKTPVCCTALCCTSQHSSSTATMNQHPSVVSENPFHLRSCPSLGVFVVPGDQPVHEDHPGAQQGGGGERAASAKVSGRHAVPRSATRAPAVASEVVLNLRVGK